jgi:signal transduction histidine kinase
MSTVFPGNGVLSDPDELPTISAGNVTWLLRLRWVACASALVLTAVARGNGLISVQAAGWLVGLCALLAASNLVWRKLAAGPRNSELLVTAQLAADMVIFTGMVYVSGGLANPIWAAIVFLLLLSVALVREAYAYALTGLASILLALLALFAITGLAPHELGHSLDSTAVAVRMGIGMVLLWGTTAVAQSASHLSRDRERQVVRAAGELRLLNSELSLVADSVGDALFLWKDDSNVLWSNAGACADFGCGAGGQMPGCGAICPHRAVVLRARETGESAEQEAVVTNNGRSRTVRARSVPLKHRNNVVDQVLLVVHDLTAERAMEQQLLQATKMGVLARVSGAMAHEIGNPLASISTRVSLLETDQDPAFVKESAVVLRGQLERIQRLVKSVQRFGRHTGGEGNDCSVETVTSEILRMVRLDPRARETIFEADIAPGMPDVSVGQDQLTQVFLNLAINAVEAMPDGGTLRVSACHIGRTVHVEFEDSGLGIPASMKERLFCPFESTKEHGTGLGLFLSRRIVNEAGGELRVRDASPHGSIFELELPVNDATAPAVEEGTWATPS